jgi:hypothetical protein
MRSSHELKIIDATLEDNQLFVYLSDGRVVLYPLIGMVWITDASNEQKQDFTVTDWEIYWNQIDDGITLEHLLSDKPRVDFTVEKPPNWKQFREIITAHQDKLESTSFLKWQNPSRFSLMKAMATSFF